MQSRSRKSSLSNAGKKTGAQQTANPDPLTTAVHPKLDEAESDYHRLIIRKLNVHLQKMMVSSTKVKVSFATFVGKIAQRQDFRVDEFILTKCIKILMEASIDYPDNSQAREAQLFERSSYLSSLLFACESYLRTNQAQLTKLQAYQNTNLYSFQSTPSLASPPVTARVSAATCLWLLCNF